MTGDPSPHSKIKRIELVYLFDLAMQTGEWRFVRQAALAWLAIYPGDLGINLILAKAWLSDDRPAPARTILERLVAVDPEYLEAWQLLETIYQPENGPDWVQAIGCLQALGGEVEASQKPPIWAAWLRDAYSRMQDGRLEGADRSLQHAIADAEVSGMPLYELICLKLAYARKDVQAIQKLTNTGRARWPGTLAFDLAWADQCMQGENDQRALAVQTLHRCAGQDATGQAARRLWGEHHAYIALWPEDMEIFFDTPLPAAVMSKLGLNRLNAGELVIQEPQNAIPIPPENLVSTPIEKAVQPQTIDPPSRQLPEEDMQAVEQTFKRLARQVKSPEIGNEDWRYPVYVIFSSQSGLLHQYGEQTAQIILKEMDQLAAAYNRMYGWEGLVFLPDDLAICSRLGLSPICLSPGEYLSDPWKLKLALVDLDTALMKQGKMIGAVIIIGGPDVIPFHRLPNPADDSDLEVLSDNPYATLDSNYFIPEWPIGRLAGEAGSDAGLLMGQLRQQTRMYGRHSKQKKGFNGLSRLKEWFSQLFSKKNGIHAVGYTAAAWRQSSAAVFRLIGRDKKLVSSPPEMSSTLDARHMMSSSLGYFNLHGLADSSDWYGQKDVEDGEPGGNGLDYPVALRPSDLEKNGRSPKIVFSEACYGAYVVSKREDEAIALKFLSLGTSVVVGSTCISYGSVMSPLIGADMLASLFWRFMRQGLTAGQALMQAKIELAQEMSKRQGYLDGEDQKTLLSFILMGDPMAVHSIDGVSSKRVVRLKQAPQIRMVADNKQPVHLADPEMVKSVKNAVEKYLPGLDQAEIYMRERPFNAEASGKKKAQAENHTVITISKQVQIASRVHSEVARVTLNEDGKLLKLVVSR